MKILTAFTTGKGTSIPCEYFNLNDGFVHQWQFNSNEIADSVFALIKGRPQSYSGWKLKMRRNGRLYLFNRGVGNYYDADVRAAVGELDQ
jgi:hypothetical protein